MERTLLHSAAQDGNLEEVKRLVGAGHSVHAYDELSYTPLHYAVRGEHYKVAVFLLESGANVNAHDYEQGGETALGVATRGEYPEMVELLLHYGASPDIPGWMGITARERAKGRTDEDGRKILRCLSRKAFLKLAEVEQLAPNPSIERTALSQLRWPKSAAHVQR